MSPSPSSPDSQEGFLVAPVQPVQGQVPEIRQASYIPKDSASATTANPQLAKPEYRDWWDARDSFLYFLEIYSPRAAASTGTEAQTEIGAMMLEAPRYLKQIEEYIQHPEAIPSRDLLAEAKEARRLADLMRHVGAAEPWGTVWAPCA